MIQYIIPGLIPAGIITFAIMMFLLRKSNSLGDDIASWKEYGFIDYSNVITPKVFKERVDMLENKMRNERNLSLRFNNKSSKYYVCHLDDAQKNIEMTRPSALTALAAPSASPSSSASSASAPSKSTEAANLTSAPVETSSQNTVDPVLSEEARRILGE